MVSGVQATSDGTRRAGWPLSAGLPRRSNGSPKQNSAVQRSTGARLGDSVRITIPPLIGSQICEFFLRNDAQMSPHGEVAGTAEFAAGSVKFSGLRKLELRFGDRARNRFQAVCRAADVDHVDNVGAGRAKAHWNPGGHFDTLRHK